MSKRRPLPRLVSAALSARLKAMPAVVVTGARQTGKSTLAASLVPAKRRYFTMDDHEVSDVADYDPQFLVDGVGPMTIDEIQRAPKFLLAIKRSIDRRRTPGRFLITGSANLLLMREVSESLAGRASYLTLWPMTRREQMGLGRGGLWEELLTAQETDWIDILLSQPDEPQDWHDLAKRGGFPTPAVHMTDDNQRAIWFDGYVRTYLERDLQDLSNIEALPDFRRLMKAACHRLGQLVNQTDLGRDVTLAQPTVHRYLNLLETSYLLVRLPAYAVNKTKRIIKSPKLYWGDTGVAYHLADGGEMGGAYLENIILNDLLAWRDSRLERAELMYWRTTIGEEVDFVVETGGRLLPIEVKSTGNPRLGDAKHLRTFRKEYGRKSRAALLLHTGSQLEWMAPDVLAVPWWRVI